MKSKAQQRRDRIGYIPLSLFILALPGITYLALAIQCTRPFICHG